MSTAHKDPYENMYCVVRGEKVFMLVPPTGAPFVDERPFAQAIHRYDAARGSWEVDLEPHEGPVNWVDAPALRPPEDGTTLGAWTASWVSGHLGKEKLGEGEDNSAGMPMLQCR